MFSSATVCTRCLGEQIDSRYRTCNKCRTGARARHQIGQQPNIGNDTHISENENTVPSNPPPNFEPSIRNDTRIPEDTFYSNPPPNFNPRLNFINLKPLAPLGGKAVLLHQQTVRRTSNHFRILYCPPIIGFAI